MPYSFNFDLTSISQSFFKELATITQSMELHLKMGDIARYIVNKFNVDELTGLNVTDSITLIEDLLTIQTRNLVESDEFEKAERKTLLLPHCSRKYMDHRCKATFEAGSPSFVCAHCSEDCLINQAVTLGEEIGYDVYVLPGGSCITKIFREHNYDAIVGVACGNEIKLAYQILNEIDRPIKALSLLKNGCAGTKFSMESLERLLS